VATRVRRRRGRPTTKTARNTTAHGTPARRSRRWSARVTARSNALDLDQGVFTWTDPRRIARSLKRSAERSRRRKSDPYRSAMSMLTFYINRAGDRLGTRQRRVLERAKEELRQSHGRTERRPTATRAARRTPTRLSGTKAKKM